MLVLSRKIGQDIIIKDDVVLKVIAIDSNKVLIGINAPREVIVHRREVYDEIVAKSCENGTR